MKFRYLAVNALVLSLAACGGGGGGNGATSGSNPAASVYQFVTPTVGVQDTYAETIVDNLNNTLNETYVSQVASVNSDGTYNVQEYDPSGDSYTSGSVNYTLYPTNYLVNNIGQDLAYTVNPPGGSASECTISPHGAGSPSPLNAGQTWAFSYTQCTNAAASSQVTYNESGQFVDVESLTVPAGTFSVYKFQSTITFTNTAGTNVTESITTWRNASSTDSHNIQQITMRTYSGATPLPGSPVSITRVLQSSTQLPTMAVKVAGQVVGKTIAGNTIAVNAKIGDALEVDWGTAIPWTVIIDSNQNTGYGNTLNFSGVSLQETTTAANSLAWTANTSAASALTAPVSFTLVAQTGVGAEPAVVFNLSNE